MRRARISLGCIVVVLAAAGGSGTSSAEDASSYPSRPITVAIPTAASVSGDILMRAFGGTWSASTWGGPDRGRQQAGRRRARCRLCRERQIRRLHAFEHYYSDLPRPIHTESALRPGQGLHTHNPARRLHARRRREGR